MNKYFGEWRDSGFFGMVADFSDVYLTEAEYKAEEAPYANVAHWQEKKRDMDAALASDDYKDAEILLADYEAEGYEGDAFVLFKRDGKLWEVNGSHCSCYGLEGQWNPEEVTAEVLRQRLERATYGRFHDDQDFRAALNEVLTGSTP